MDHNQPPFGDPRFQELDRLVRESERSMRELELAMRDLRGLTGQGENRAGTVSARVDADSRPVEVRISARAMRLDPEELGREVVAAVRAAQEDHERQTQERLAGVATPDESLLSTFKRDLEELQDSYSREWDERLDDMRRGRRGRED